jgi:hypothetical protein
MNEEGEMPGYFATLLKHCNMTADKAIITVGTTT